MLTITSFDYAERRPNYRLMVRDPSVCSVLIHGKPPAVAVALGGKFGDGREMVLDVADWDRVRSTLGPSWTLIRTGPRQFMVASSRALATRGTGSKVANLARWIVRAKPGTRVEYENGDPTDLRRLNLKLRKPHSKAPKRKHGKRPPLDSFVRQPVHAGAH